MGLRTWYTLTTLLALAVVLASDAEAQTVPSPYTFIEARQEAGLIFGKVDAASGRFGYAPKGGNMFGGRYGIELSGPLSLEGVATLIDGTRDVINPGRVEGDRVVGEADVLLTTFDARFKFTLTGDRAWHRLAPFIVAGGGVVLDISDEAEDDALLEPEDQFDYGTSFYGTTGLGVRWFLTDTFALRLDGTFSLWKVGTPPGFSDPIRGFESVEEGEWLRSLGLTVSTLIRW
ncbi:MAG: outer membrane beta-barrel protein [Gemmatimonadota bacterium]